MFIIFHFNLYPPCGIARQNSVTSDDTYKNINSRVLKASSAGNVKVTKKALKAATKEVYEKIMLPLKRHLG